MDKALTYDSKVVEEAPGLRVPEVDPAPVDALVVAPDVVDDELGRLGRGAEVGPGAEHFRRRPVTRLRQGLPPHIKTGKKTERNR